MLSMVPLVVADSEENQINRSNLNNEKSIKITRFALDMSSNVIHLSWEYTGDIDCVNIALYQGETYIKLIRYLVDADIDFIIWHIPPELNGIDFAIRVSNSYDSSIYHESQPFDLRPFPSYILGILIILAIVSILSSVYFIFNKRKDDKEAILYPNSVSIVKQEKIEDLIKKCQNCNSEIVDPTTNFCMFCGYEIKREFRNSYINPNY